MSNVRASDASASGGTTHPAATREKRPVRAHRGRRALAAFAVGTLAVAGVAGAVPPRVLADTPQAPAPAARAQARPETPAVFVYRQASPSVVNITSLAVVQSPRGAASGGGQPGQFQPQGTGSGFIIDTRGHIVTNNHVVEDAEQHAVTFQDHTTVPATLVGRDPDNDLAVIRVDPNATDQDGRAISGRLKPVTLGESARVVIGQDAIAIGSPLGLQQSVTSGIVSAIRNPGEEVGPGQDIDLLGGAVQTDAAINPGNSGGPLFNASAEVIGVNTAGLAPGGGSIGLNFAIPIDVVKRVAPELITGGCYRHPLVGISALPLSQLGTALKQQLGIPVSQRGLLVQEASAGAAQAGIRAGEQTVNAGGGQLRAGGDIIVAIDGRQLATGGDLRAHVENSKRPGESVTLSVLREGQRRDVQVQLSERPNEVCR